MSHWHFQKNQTNDSSLSSYCKIQTSKSAFKLSPATPNTLAAARGNGLAGVLLDHVHATTPDPLVMDAQTYLVPWYTSMGYQRSGPEFIEDGIAHVPMTREPTGD